jgi:hypothetical protein
MIFGSLNSSEKISLAKSMASEKRVCQIQANFSDFVGITVKGILEKNKSLFRAFWQKVYELKEIETLGGSIEKIETLMAELKIAANFKE